MVHILLGVATLPESLSTEKVRNERPRLLSAKDTARMLGVHFNTLSKWRIRGSGPPFIKAGTRVIYRFSEVERWLDSRTHLHTTEYGVKEQSRR